MWGISDPDRLLSVTSRGTRDLQMLTLTHGAAVTLRMAEESKDSL